MPNLARTAWILIAALLLTPGPARAAQVLDCADRDLDRLLVQPLDKFSQSYDGGKIWIAALNHGVGGVNILVRVIGFDPDQRICKIVVAAAAFDTGWAQAIIADTKLELLETGVVKLNVPVQLFSGQDQIWDVAEILIMRDTVDVRAIGP